MMVGRKTIRHRAAPRHLRFDGLEARRLLAPVAVDDNFYITEDEEFRNDGSPYTSFFQIEQAVEDLVADPIEPRIFLAVPSPGGDYADSLLILDANAAERSGETDRATVYIEVILACEDQIGSALHGRMGPYSNNG